MYFTSVSSRRGEWSVTITPSILSSTKLFDPRDRSQVNWCPLSGRSVKLQSSPLQNILSVSQHSTEKVKFEINYKKNALIFLYLFSGMCTSIETLILIHFLHTVTLLVTSYSKSLPMKLPTGRSCIFTQNATVNSGTDVGMSHGINCRRINT